MLIVAGLVDLRVAKAGFRLSLESLTGVPAGSRSEHSWPAFHTPHLSGSSCRPSKGFTGAFERLGLFRR